MDTSRIAPIHRLRVNSTMTLFKDSCDTRACWKPLEYVKLAITLDWHLTSLSNSTGFSCQRVWKGTKKTDHLLYNSGYVTFL